MQVGTILNLVLCSIALNCAELIVRTLRRIVSDVVTFVVFGDA